MQPRAKAWAVASPLAWPPLRDRIASAAPLIYAAPDDAATFFRVALADVALAPMRSETGSSLKIPEDIAHGKTVVGTPIGLRGYEALFRFPSAVAPDDMVAPLAEGWTRLQRDPESDSTACREARNWVKRKLDWSVAAQSRMTALEATG